MKSVNQRNNPMSRILMMVWISAAAVLMAQDEPATPPPDGVNPPPANGANPPPRRPGGPGKTSVPGKSGNPGKTGDPRFSRPGSNMSPMQPGGFERLPEEEKKRVREAIEKAWTLPALQQAKDRYIKANEEFRAVMRRSLTEVDPEVVRILDKIQSTQPFEPRTLPKLPPPSDDGFAKAAVERLGMELMAFTRPENRDKVRVIHPKVMQQPKVAEAVKYLLEAPADKREAALSRLREEYRKAVATELPNLPRPQQRTSADASGQPAAPDAPPPAVQKQ